jgi:hypothetical protein
MKHGGTAVFSTAGCFTRIATLKESGNSFEVISHASR